MLNKSLFTAIIKSTGNTGSRERVSAAAVNKQVIMQWRVKPASSADMVNPVIQTGNNTYVGAQWTKDPADTNWLIGTTRIKVVGGLLKGPGIQSASYGMQSDWVKITGEDTSSVIFFDDFLAQGDCNLTGTMLCGKPALDSTFTDVQPSPCADTTNLAVTAATQIYNAYKDSLSDYFNEAYTAKCLGAFSLESFTLTHPASEYHYTLYYYDQAGNLVKTIPPEGVHPDRDTAWLRQVEEAKAAGTARVPAHTMPTVYRYNSLNQVVSQSTPDAGISSFWYDKLGRPAISQNAKQASPPSPPGEGSGVRLYSYTLYDPIGRIAEAGQKPQPTLMTNIISRNPVALASWLNFNNASFAYNATQVTSTVYDVVSPVTKYTFPWSPYSPVKFAQQAYTLRNRVSYTQYYDVLQNNPPDPGTLYYKPLYHLYTTGTYYAYDIHGNVDTLLQDYRNGIMSNHGYNRFKEITYNYDLISGKVNEVDYQPGAVDQFYHRYEYDAENRITDVYTSDHKAYVGHKNLEDHEAFYEYYKHGPLARSVIGQQQVQGIDYAYTLQGWLKGVNSTALNPVYDMGGDGAVPPSGGGGDTRDAYSFGLNYFQNDYAPINSTVSPFPGFSGLFSAGYSFKPLYNGNISAMSVNISKLNNPLLYNYQYDQLNRLVAMDAFSGLDTSNNTWHTLTTDNSYQERVSYDANGNIQKYLRNGTIAGGTPLGMDSLTYKYNRDAVGQLINNQLSSVNDSVPAGNYPDDIDNQSANNYGYDAIGNMTSDAAGGINNITWTVYGKIATITKTDGSTVAYTYDAAGNRISKTVTPKKGKATATWYVRDAGGNTMAVYTATGSDSLRQTEQHLYGSSRIGIFNRNINADAALPTGTSANLIGNYVISYFTRGNKNYEGDNHLGNVLITFTDKKFGVDANGDGIVDYYIADVVSANDYYPFGMMMPGRKYSIANTDYRYGFNGKEVDNDIENGAQDYGMRIYDGRLGKFLSVDPLTSKYPELTPYQFASNRTLQGVDLDGKEVLLVTGSGGGFGLFAGGDIGGGIAFGRDGIALVAIENARIGIGLEMGAGINVSLFPTLEGVGNIKNSDEPGGGIDKGFSVSADWIAKVGAGVSESEGHWGITGSYGFPSVGGHLSFDMGMTIAHKIIKWKDVVGFITSATQQSKQLQKLFGLNDKNINNAQAIIKNYFVNVTTSLINKRINDLNNKNAQDAETIKNANEYLDDYKKSSGLYKFFNSLVKKQAEAEKNEAQKDIEKNNSEKITLQKTKIKFE